MACILRFCKLDISVERKLHVHWHTLSYHLRIVGIRVKYRARAQVDGRVPQLDLARNHLVNLCDFCACLPRRAGGGPGSGGAELRCKIRSTVLTIRSRLR
jgi:hypothetical protein